MNFTNTLNVGYFLVLKENNEGLLYVDRIDVPIPEKVEAILEQLDKFENNISYIVADIFIVQNWVERLRIPSRKQYSYCWPHEYNERYITAAMIPKKLTAKGLTESEYNEHLKSIEDRVTYIYNTEKKNWPYIEDRQKYRKEIAKWEKERDREIRLKQGEYKEKVRNEYIDEVRRYIYAQCIDRVMPNIAASSIMYSNEKMGWYKPDYKISDDVLISIRTNFCYGNAAHFHVNLNYKGINILPYSDIVIYYYSNMMDNIRYTVDYVPKRSNWVHAMSFVADISNLIKTDRERFEKEWIIDKIEKMMDGLKTINNDINKYFKMQVAAKQKAIEKNTIGEDDRIIKYRNVDDTTIEQFKVYEHEILLSIQVDKLTAALSLLDNLTTLQNIYTPILNHIETIVQYNERLIPAIDSCRNSIQRRLELLNRNLNELNKEQESFLNTIQAIRAEKDNYLEETNEQYQKWSTQNPNKKKMLSEECTKDENYKIINENLRRVTETIDETQREIHDREKYDKHLEEKNEFIKKTLDSRKQSSVIQ